MDGGTFAFVAGCIFFGLGVLLILSLLQYLRQRTGWNGRATGNIVAIGISSAAEGRQTIAKAADALVPDTVSPRYYRAVVAYEVDGQHFQVRGPFSMRSFTARTTFVGDTATPEIQFGPLRYDVGDKVRAAYDRSSPASAIVIERRREVTVVALQILCGLISMIIGLLVFYANGNLAWLGPDWQHY